MSNCTFSQTTVFPNWETGNLDFWGFVKISEWKNGAKSRISDFHGF